MAIELTAFEKEQAQCAKKIGEYKLTSEANIVASIFKNPELLYNIDLKLEDFSHNIWKCWFAVANGLIIKEKKLGLDEITVGIYLEKHPQIKRYAILADAHKEQYENPEEIRKHLVFVDAGKGLQMENLM